MRSVLILAATAVLLAASLPLAAQSMGTVRGTVVEAGSRRPLTGAQVVIPGTDRTAVTNAAGEFRMANVPAGSHRLRAQLIGYTPVEQTVDVAMGETAQASFTLGQAAVALDALVVTGTPIESTRRAVGNAVTTIDAEAVTRMTGATSVTEILQARSPGVQIMPNSGAPGTAANITIRGAGSFVGSDPVVYVDGIRMNTGSLGTFTPSGAGIRSYSGQGTNALHLINPQDIESIEVIKGPAAATLYGAEAAGGVIQIITKKGKAGQQRPQWTVSAQYGVNGWGVRAPNRYTTCDPAKISAVIRGTTDPLWPGCQGVAPYTLLTDNPLETDPDAVRDGSVERMSLSVRGGGEGHGYYLNVDRDRENGIFHNSFSNKQSVRGNFTLSPSSKFDVQVTSSYLRNHIRLPLGDEAFMGLLFSAYRGSPGRQYTNGIGWMSTNPQQANTYDNQTRSDRVTLGATANYRPFEWFTNRVTVGMDYTGSQANIVDEPGSVFTPRGLHAMRVPRNWVHTLNYAGNLRRYFLDDALGSTTSFGVQVAARRGETVYARGLGLGAPGITLIGTAQDVIGLNSYYENNSVGTFVQQEFSWQDRLFVTGAVRADDHSSFGEEFDFIVYPKLSLSYVASEEPALQGLFSRIGADNFRVRAAWGQAGRAPSAYSATRTYGVGRVALGSSVGSTLVTGAYGNPDLQPELGTELEVGFDASFFDNRLGAEFTSYNKKTTNLLMPTPVAPSTGWVGSRLVNVGEIRNSGMELALWGTPIVSRAVTWEPRVTLATNSNELVDFGSDITKQIPWQPYGQWNVRQEHREGYPLAGWWARYPAFDENNEPILNSRGALTWSDSAVFVGPAMPKWEASLSNTVTLFGNLRAYALLDFKGGHYVFNAREFYRCRFSDNCERLNDPTLRNAALIEKDPAAVKQFELWRTAQPMYLEKADFTKLRDVSLTYSVPSRWMERFRGNTASVTVAGHNLGLWTDYSGLDPEVNTYGPRDFVRVDAYAQPMIRRWSLSVNVGF